ncbi:BrnA antitoxin family protein [Methylobacterium sp. J-059]|uniref:BrnA antitoxin family protein n=1 Tax=Methylobacterium sp. J-059 TaxID=2836643 RepID=UPI001FBB5299|nr:BrnA antitoxin family protein [Methylobacterium sp. J-059]MCJ2042894.1 BrnA antitoxin family protein [Methylobacterium sp. J-059]
MAGRPTQDPDEAPPLTQAELTEMRPAHEVHSAEVFAALTSVRRRGRPLATNKKVPVTIRLDAETVTAFKAMGPRWQTRMNEALASSLLTEEMSVFARFEMKHRDLRIDFSGLHVLSPALTPANDTIENAVDMKRFVS